MYVGPQTTIKHTHIVEVALPTDRQFLETDGDAMVESTSS